MKQPSIIIATVLVAALIPTVAMAEDEKTPVRIEADEAFYQLASSNGDAAVGPLLPQLLLRSGHRWQEGSGCAFFRTRRQVGTYGNEHGE